MEVDRGQGRKAGEAAGFPTDVARVRPGSRSSSNDPGARSTTIAREAQEPVEIVLEGAPSMTLTLAGVGTIRVSRKPASA
jgi:hypothetical protein